MISDPYILSSWAKIPSSYFLTQHHTRKHVCPQVFISFWLWESGKKNHQPDLKHYIHSPFEYLCNMFLLRPSYWTCADFLQQLNAAMCWKLILEMKFLNMKLAIYNCHHLISCFIFSWSNFKFWTWFSWLINLQIVPFIDRLNQSFDSCQYLLSNIQQFSVCNDVKHKIVTLEKTEQTNFGKLCLKNDSNY